MRRSAPSRLVQLVILLGLCGMSRPVYAHSQIPGIADFWSGMLHPFYTASHILLLAGLGLHMGQHAPRNTAVSVIAFIVASGFGLGVSAGGLLHSADQLLLLVVAMFTAILIVIGSSLPEVASAALFACGALLLGLDSAAENAPIATVIKMSLGTWLCMCLVVFNLAFYAARLTKQWQKVAIRVAGSWMVAISILVLAFALKR